MIRSWPMLLLALVIAVAGVAGYLGFRAGRVPELPIISTVPDFTLVDQDGKPLAAKDLKGKVWVADAIFTHCSSVCPRMTDRLEDVQYKTRGFDDVRFVSFSVDPEHDTPDALKQFGGEHSVPFGRWELLTGPRDAIASVVTQAMKLHFAPSGDTIEHDVHAVLVDRQLRVRGVYDTTDDKALDRLAADLGILATHR